MIQVKDGGGNTLNKPPVYTVKNLQKNLKAAGTFTDSENGIFGPKTETALKISQWTCSIFVNFFKIKFILTRAKKASIVLKS